jgi:SAM-dependent methyltransferase
VTSQNIAFYDQIASSYHLFFRDLSESMEQEGRWLSDILEPAGVRTVLDAGCGTGRQAIPLAERGFTVAAADPSRPMLDIARDEAAHRSLSVEFVESTFADLPARVSRTFDAVISMGNSLCNLQSADAVAVALAALRDCCAAGGICIVGIKDFDRIRAERRRLHPHRVVEGSEGTRLLFELWSFEDPILVSTTFLLGRQVGDSKWTTSVAATHEYMLGREELQQLAIESGFRSCEPVAHRCEAAFLLRP